MKRERTTGKKEALGVLGRVARWACGGVLLFFLGWSWSVCGGDVVRLLDGRVLEGRVLEAGDQVLVEGDEGTVRVRRGEVAAIELGAPPEQVFAGRLKQAIEAQDAPACVRLAGWAQEQGLASEYVAALRTALLLDRGQEEAREALRRYAARYRILPVNEEAARRLLREMGASFRVFRTEHYRIAYAGGEPFAVATAKRLEATYGRFMRFFEARYFQPAPLTDRLEVVLFEDRKGFEQYVASEEPTLRHSSGFYLSRTGRCYFYDRVNDEQYREQLAHLETARQEVAALQSQVEEGKGERFTVRRPDGTEAELDKAELLGELAAQQQKVEGGGKQLQALYREMNVSVTVHEAVHQLAYTCGIHSRYYETPKWLSEGLAMYFDSAADARGRVLTALARQRLGTFKDNQADGKGLGLESLLGDDDLFSLEESDGAQAYAAGWALFYYLSRHRHEQLFDYLYEVSLRISNEPYGRQERWGDFEKYFGDIKDVERHWRYWMSAQE